MKKRITLPILLILLSLFSRISIAQSQTDSLLREHHYRIGWAIDIGALSMGVSEFNKGLNQLGAKPVADYRYAINITRTVIHPSRVTTNLGVTVQSYSFSTDKIGGLTYSFSKSILSYQVGYLLKEHKRFMIPVSAGLGLSSMLFNSHVNQNNVNTSFQQAVANGTGPGIFNMFSLDALALFSAGLDVKTNLFKDKKCRFSSTNFGVKIQYMYTLGRLDAPFDPGLKSVTDRPKTDDNLIFIGFHMVQLLNDCKRR